MRISDWSSDVLSSDLVHRTLCRTRHPRYRNARLDSQPSPFASTPLQPGSKHLRRLLAKVCGLSLRAGRQIAGSRSEEHTSELQSLMRISYAVFCLKKKIIN